MFDRWSLSAVLLGLVGTQACGHAAAGNGSKSARAKEHESKIARVGPARLMALPDSSASLVDQDPDGTLRFISRGMRLMSRPDGSIERGRQLFPTTRTMRTLALPDRLGGGFVFYSTGSGSTQLWRAPSWTGDLQPLAQLDFDADRVVDGFDRIYVLDQRSFDVVALDPVSGKPVELGPIPPSPAYSSMAFADAWFGAVEVPFRGVMVSFDAGASWRPLGTTQSYGVSLERGEIAINTSQGRWLLGPDGTLHQRGAGTDDDVAFVGAGRRPGAVTPVPTAPPPEPPPPLPIGPLGKLPLLEALLHGIPEADGTAVVAKDGALGRVRLSDGKLLDVDERAFPSGGVCTGVRLGRGVGFVCGQERGATTVYQLDEPLSLRQVMRFDDPRYVASSGNGALVIRGPCKGAVSKATGAYCIRNASGRTSEMRVRGDLGVERIVALSDGRTAVLVPPRLGAPGTLTLVRKDGKATTVRLRLPKEDAPTLAMLRKGLWLDGFQERETSPKDAEVEATGGEQKKTKKLKLPPKANPKKGKSSGPPSGKKLDAKATIQPKSKLKQGKKQLFGWVVAAGPFVGVRVDLDGTVHVGRIESDIDRAMISGELALVVGRGGTASETTDGGFAWSDVNLPPEASSTVARTRSSQEQERGCSAVGCVIGSWMRIGWGQSDEEDKDVDSVEAPHYSTLPSSGGGRWKLSCVPTGEVAGAAAKPGKTTSPDVDEYGVIGVSGMYGYRPPHRGYGRPAPSGELEGTEWLPFKGVAAPAKKRTDLGFDFGTEHMSTQIRGYAWGARGASWDRVGSFQLRAFDEFSLRDAVWSTAVGRSPWGDTSAVAGVFGQDMNSPSAWNPSLEPSGRAAAVLVNARGTSELLLAEEGHSPTLIHDAAKWGLYQLSGVVKVGSTWYVGSFISGSSFRLFRVSNGHVELVREYPITGGWRPNTTLVASLVRNVRGDSLGIWVEARRTRGSSTSWYVYAVDPESGDIVDMMDVTPKELASLPPTCEDGAEGWLLIGEPPVDPYVDYLQSANDVRSRRLSAQWIVDTRGVCVEALSAEADTPVPARLTRGDIASVARGVEPVNLVLEERGRGGRRWGFRCVR